MTVAAVDPAKALQIGIYQRLTGDAELMGLVTGVWNEAPEDQDLDYVVVGTRKQSIPDDVHGRHGRQNIVDVDTWTRARSSIPGDNIGARVVELLTRQHEALDALVDGHVVWMAKWEFSQSLVDPDRELRHRTDRFRFHTSQDEEE
jgi:hypothetical protein